MKLTNTNLVAKILKKAKESIGAISWDSITDKPTIPSALSQLTDDSTHRTVTDTEKTLNNSKIIFTYFT